MPNPRSYKTYMDNNEKVSLMYYPTSGKFCLGKKWNVKGSQYHDELVELTELPLTQYHVHCRSPHHHRSRCHIHPAELEMQSRLHHTQTNHAYLPYVFNTTDGLRRPPLTERWLRCRCMKLYDRIYTSTDICATTALAHANRHTFPPTMLRSITEHSALCEHCLARPNLCL